MRKSRDVDFSPLKRLIANEAIRFDRYLDTHGRSRGNKLNLAYPLNCLQLPRRSYLPHTVCGSGKKRPTLRAYQDGPIAARIIVALTELRPPWSFPC